jgi:hypothetical protein
VVTFAAYRREVAQRGGSRRRRAPRVTPAARWDRDDVEERAGFYVTCTGETAYAVDVSRRIEVAVASADARFSGGSIDDEVKSHDRVHRNGRAARRERATRWNRDNAECAARRSGRNADARLVPSPARYRLQSVKRPL